MARTAAVNKLKALILGAPDGLRQALRGLSTPRQAARCRTLRVHASLGYDPAGKRIVKRGSGRTKTEAKAKLRQVLRDHEDGLIIAPGSHTVARPLPTGSRTDSTAATRPLSPPAPPCA